MRVKRKRRRRYTRLYILAAVMVMAVALFAVFHFMGRQAPGEIESESGIALNQQVIHVLIMGVDRRSDDVGRSDTLMVLTVNKDTGKGEIMSIPRDTRVKIPGNGYDKINHAYPYGGAKLTRSTVEKLLGIPMDYYVLIDLRSFERIIDALDGIDIDVEKRMFYEDPWDDNGGLVIDLYPGMQHMTGDKAIQYIRYRDGEGDIGRINRQQHFVRAVMTKLLTPDILPKLPQIVGEVRKSLETDMPLTEMLSLANMLPQLKENGLASGMIPGKPAFLDDVSYWLPDIVEVRELMAEQMGSLLDEKARLIAQTVKQEYEASLPAGMVSLKDDSPARKSNDNLKVAEKDDNKPDSGEDTEKDREKKEVKKSKARMADGPGQISVLVINDSGINGAGAKMVNKLLDKGFNVTGVDTGSKSDREHTIIVTDESNVNWFYGMPFSCTIMAGADPLEAVVYVGKDFE